jgi:hypothetical protein
MKPLLRNLIRARQFYIALPPQVIRSTLSNKSAGAAGGETSRQRTRNDTQKPGGPPMTPAGLSIELGDSAYAPFSQQEGLGRAAQLFGVRLNSLLEELNGVLVA